MITTPQLHHAMGHDLFDRPGDLGPPMIAALLATMTLLPGCAFSFELKNSYLKCSISGNERRESTIEKWSRPTKKIIYFDLIGPYANGGYSLNKLITKDNVQDWVYVNSGIDGVRVADGYIESTVEEEKLCRSKDHLIINRENGHISMSGFEQHDKRIGGVGLMSSSLPSASEITTDFLFCTNPDGIYVEDYYSFEGTCKPTPNPIHRKF